MSNQEDKVTSCSESNASENTLAQSVSLLAHFSEEVSGSLDTSKIIDSTCKFSALLLPSDAIFIGLFNEREQVIAFDLVIENNTRLPPFSIPLTEKNTPQVSCINSKAPLIVNDMDGEHSTALLSSRFRTPMENDKVSSLIYWPMIMGEKIIGILAVQSYTENAYPADAQNIMRALANIAATGFNNAATYQEILEQKSLLNISDKNVQVISEIGKEINSTLNLETVLWTVYQHVNKMMDATVFGIGLYDPDEELIRVDLAMEKGKRYKPYTRTMKIKNQFPVWCIENKDVVFINDIRKEGKNYFEVNEYDTWEKVRVVLEDDAFSGKPVSLIYVPMMLNEMVYGFITVQSFQENVYKKVHVDILKSIAGYTVNAIANARAHQQLKQTQESLRAAKKDAEQSAELKIRFLANMSHEIRTPMNIILGFMEVVLDGERLSAEDREHINTAHVAAKSLLTIINDILDITKNESGKLAIESTAFNLFELLQEISHLLSFQAKDKGLDFKLEFDPDIPRSYIGDPTRINQVLLNLAGNAIKFTSEGFIKIKVSKHKGSQSVLFSVSDTGIGIAPENQASIFEIFTQADASTTRNFGGTGLGTTICRQLVEAMQGNIWVESEQGKGSVFSFTLPLQAVDDNKVKSASLRAQKRAISSRKLNVLLAEDTAPNALLMSIAMKKKGHSLTIVEDGLEAIKAVKENDFDLVLMDVQMPTMDGLTATKKIRQLSDPRKKNIPIIAMSASALPDDQQACIKAGMNLIHPKPVNFEELYISMGELAR